jgi:adenylate cyclase
MSGLEIERKFLVKKGDAFKRAAFSSSHIQQGYIPCDGATVRIRIRDDKAYLTIKGKSVNGGMTRYEFEKEIALDEAGHLMQLCPRRRHRQAPLSSQERCPHLRGGRVLWRQ